VCVVQTYMIPTKEEEQKPMAGWFDIQNWSDLTNIEDLDGLRSSVKKVEELVHKEQRDGKTR
jgi:hypothetical protein